MLHGRRGATPQAFRIKFCFKQLSASRENMLTASVAKFFNKEGLDSRHRLLLAPVQEFMAETFHKYLSSEGILQYTYIDPDAEFLPSPAMLKRKILLKVCWLMLMLLMFECYRNKYQANGLQLLYYFNSEISYSGRVSAQIGSWTNLDGIY
jgi:hypothetical protein